MFYVANVPLIGKIQNLICLNGDPFTTNYMMLKRYYFYFIKPVYYNSKGALMSNYELREKTFQENYNAYLEIINGSYEVVMDIIDSILIELNHNFLLEKLNIKTKGSN